MTLLREGVMLIEFAVLVLYAIVMIFKRVKPAKFFLNLAFGLYLSAVIAVCFFPIKFSGTLPDPALNNFIPFKGIIDALRDFVNSSSLYSLATLAGNFVMLMPLGIFFHFYIKEPKRRLLGVFLFSVGIETIQFIIGMLIGYNYRSIDIDDVILNTVGGVLAVLVFDFIVKKYRQKKSAAENITAPD